MTPAASSVFFCERFIPMKPTRVRIRASGQVIEMVPAVARAMILGGTAVEVDENGRPVESMTLEQTGERAVAPAQRRPPLKKPRRSKSA
jgi:hypothetical protein